MPASNPRPWRAIIAGGGTGGHVFPALALATSLESLGVLAENVVLVGSKRGQESLLLKGSRFPVVLLAGRGIQRKPSFRALMANLAACGALFVGLFHAMILHLRFRPDVVASVGGYAALGSSIGAVIFRCPLVLVNIDAVPGLTHRLLGRFAKVSAVGFATTPLPRSVVTGTPVRDEICKVERTRESRLKARGAFGWGKDVFVVGFVGGSLGARRINEAACELGYLWQNHLDRGIIHVTGRREYERFKAETTDFDTDRYQLKAFEGDMASLYECVDVMVCRAGAVTVAELALARVPSILVPLPGAPGDHQSANARALLGATAAEFLIDQTCCGNRVNEILQTFLSDRDRLSNMEQALEKIARPGAARLVGELVIKYAKKTP